MGSYLLATKVEEKLVPLRDVIVAFHYLYLSRTRSALQMKPLELGGDLYGEWKNELICIERNILRELGFSLYNSFSHPHQYLLYVIKLLEGNDLLAQTSWNYINDSMHLKLIVDYHSLYIVCAAIFLASRTISYPLPESPIPWWKLLNLDNKVIYQIANEIMSLYSYEKVGYLLFFTFVLLIVMLCNTDRVSSSGSMSFVTFLIYAGTYRACCRMLCIVRYCLLSLVISLFIMKIVVFTYV